MAKHLKKKKSGVKLFSSKPSADKKPDDVLEHDPPEPETAVGDDFSISDDSGGYDTEPTAADISRDDESDADTALFEPAPERDITSKSAPKHTKKTARHIASRDGSKGSGRKEYKAESTGARIYADKRTYRRAALAAGVVVLTAVLIIAAVKLGGNDRVNPLAEDYVFSPHCVDSTKPDKLISETAVMVNDDEPAGYTAPQKLTVNMPSASDYTDAAGIIGFRGDNFRSGASYGTVSAENNKLTSCWSTDTGVLKDADGNTWSGSGWTGQPLIVQWPQSTREKMTSMYDWARTQDDLVEAIYPTMDGNIYFLELSTGKATRAPMELGYTFKGTGALDPRGYPILYIGSGVNSTLGKSRVFVIDLIDCSVMYRFGYYEPFAQRDWNMWDASPLVDAATDQLIYPGENGVLYIVHLNTLYNEAAGTVTVSPDNTVRWRYTSDRTTTYTFWSGVESSPVCWQGHLIMADNGGNLMCLDLNTLKLDWVQDVLDDTNCSPVLSLEEDGVYIYIGTSFHPGWRDENSAKVPVWKINAVTGETVWKTEYTCTGDGGLCGGVQGTIALGKNGLSGLVFVPVACTPDSSGGVLAALDAKTGKEVWSLPTASYSWSSPLDIYAADGTGRIVYCTTDGTVYLLDGLTGKILAASSLGGAIEASPASFNNYIVVGTRDSKIRCLEIDK